MKVRNAVIILSGVLLFFASCSKKEGESELRAVINEMHDELIEYEKNMTRAASAKEVADEIVRHYRKMAEFADTLKQIGEKYPGLNNEKYAKKYTNEDLIEEVNKKVNPVLEKYGGESEVSEAYWKVVEEIKVNPTVSND